MPINIAAQHLNFAEIILLLDYVGEEKLLVNVNMGYNMRLASTIDICIKHNNTKTIKDMIKIATFSSDIDGGIIINAGLIIWMNNPILKLL